MRYVAVDLAGAPLAEGQLAAHSNDPEEVFRELSGTLSDLTLPPFKLSIRPITSAFGHTPQSIFEYVAVLV